MNENNRESFFSLNLLSTEKSLIVEGSAIVKRNMIIERDLILDGFINTPEIETMRDCIMINRNIVSNKKDHRYDLGEEKRRWNNIYANNVNSYKMNSKEITTANLLVNNDIYLDETSIYSKNNMIMCIDGNSMSLKTNVFDVNGLLTINKDMRHILLNGCIMTSMMRINNYLQLTPQKLIAKKTGKIVVLGSLILVTIEDDCEIELISPEGILFNDTYVRVVVELVKKGSLGVKIGENIIKLNKKCDYIEILLSDANTDYIGGNCCIK